MPNLNAPSQTTFLASLVIAILAWIAYFASIPYIGDHPSGLPDSRLCLSCGWLLIVVLRMRRVWGEKKNPAAYRRAFSLRPPCGEDGQCWFAQWHLMGAAILDASRWEGDDAVGKVDLRTTATRQSPRDVDQSTLVFRR
jgi:hypothetical protein